MEKKMQDKETKEWKEELRKMFPLVSLGDLLETTNFILEIEQKAREEGREELLDSIVVGIEQLKSIVEIEMFNPMSIEIRAKQSGEIEAYNGLLEKLSKLKDNK